MRVETLIESYVGEIVARLPGRKRADVAAELEALLTEEIAARAAAAGRAPDEAIALEVVRGFGRPAEVAARYGPSPGLLDPADTRDLIVAAVAGSLVLVGLGQVTLQHPPRDWATITVLSWLGFLVLFFGGAHWARQHWPTMQRWRPRDRDHANRFACAALAAVIVAGILCYGAPTWVFATFTGGARLTPWLAYTDDFQRFRLPWLLGLWSLTAGLILWVAIEGRWRPLTRRIEAALQAGVCAVLVWFLLDGPMFRTAEVDQHVKSAMVIVIVFLLADVALKLRRLGGRPRLPANLASASAAR